MFRENIQVTTRLVQGGAFSHIPEVESKIQNVIRQCPTIYQSSIAVADRLDHEERESTLAVEGDHLHDHALAARRFGTAYIRDTIGLPTNCHEIPHGHPFALELRAAYDADYHMPSVYHLESMALQWVKMFSFTVKYVVSTIQRVIRFIIRMLTILREQEQRFTFSIGDFVEIHNAQRSRQLARVDAAFVHVMSKRSKIRRLFLIVNLFSDAELPMDDVLGLPRRRLSGNQALVGLPAITGKKFYMVALGAPRSKEITPYLKQKYLRDNRSQEEVEQTDECRVVVHCTWHISFL
jgi:hypothetical protein